MLSLPSRPLAALSTPGPLVLALLYSLESLARSLMATVIPLQAYQLLKDPASVSALFAAVGLLGLAFSFAIPALIRWTARRHVYRIGGAALILAAALIASATLLGQASGMLARLFAIACLNVTFNLYLTDLVARRGLSRAEPLRLAFSAGAWTIGPFLGVWMQGRWGIGATAAASAACALFMLLYFTYLRLGERIPRVTQLPPVAPWPTIRRFLKQPRLKLGWVIPFGRSCWWSVLFTYGPIAMVAGGAGEAAGAALVSLSNALLFLSPLFGKIGALIGLRAAIAASFLCLGLTTMAAGFAPSPYAAMAMLLVGSIFATQLDAVGNIPFLRAVRSTERAEMVTVFRTYIDLSDLIPVAIFTLLLRWLPVETVFLVTGAAMAAFALFARYVPRGM
ncbi:MAG TPA: MFS transporter [Alphaproteobacteria bacterium]|nr:MFS transporter [Alphaproteobacteria bacterium]